MYDLGNLEDEAAVGFILNAFDLYFVSFYRTSFYSLGGCVDGIL